MLALARLSAEREHHASLTAVGRTEAVTGA
jgi:hypothetical protein